MGSLSTYHAKRNFSITAEPRGKVAKGKSYRFVIQRHAATRLHYDLRLELGGVYLSWAVTRTPSLDVSPPSANSPTHGSHKPTRAPCLIAFIRKCPSDNNG